MTRILLFSPSTNPRATLFSGWQYAVMPSQWRSISAANFSNGLSRCHRSDARELLSKSVEISGRR